MKRILFIMLFIPTILWGQTTNHIKDREFNSLSEYANFSKAPGSAVKSEEVNLKNNLDYAIFKVVIATNMETKETKYGLMVSTLKSLSLGNVERNNTYFDVDEIDICLNMLNYINDNVINTPANEVISGYTYYNRDNGLIGIGSDQKKWVIFLNAYLYTDNTKVYYKSNQLPELIRLFTEAKTIIADRNR